MLFDLQTISNALGIPTELVLGAIVLLAVWSMAWKGLALWYAARASQRGWFIALLVVNTAGILEIVYLIAFRKRE